MTIINFGSGGQLEKGACICSMSDLIISASFNTFLLLWEKSNFFYPPQLERVCDVQTLFLVWYYDKT